MKKIIEKLPNLVLIFVSLLSFLYGVIDIFLEIDKIPYLKKAPQVSLVLLSTIGLAVGIEKLVNFKELQEDLNQIKKRIDSISPSQFFETREEAYLFILSIVSDAEEIIYILSNIGTDDTKESRERSMYIDTLISVMESNTNLTCRYVLSVSNDNPFSEDEKKAIKSRKNKFENKNLLGRVTFKTILLPVGLNIMVVDRKHVAFGFPNLSSDQSMGNLLKFSDNSKLANKIYVWFDEYIWDKGKVY